MDYNDTDAEKWQEHFEFEERLARRNPEQFRTYLDNLQKAGERAKEISVRKLYDSFGDDIEKFDEGDGWLKIDWK